MSGQEKSFENALSELEQLISEVEGGTLPLEKMIERISQGAQLIRLCQNKLNAMNSQVELLFRDDGQKGEFQTFDPTTERSQSAVKTETNTAVSTESDQAELPF